MATNLKAGNLDGYCVGEPWNSLAVAQRAGWVVALSSEIDFRHPEKVLLVRTEFATSRSEDHERLIIALLEACEFCQLPQNRWHVAETLAAPKYLNVNAEIIHSSLCGVMSVRKAAPASISALHIFAGTEVNEPTLQKAAWARQSLVESGVLPKNQPLDRQQLSSIFRSDLFQAITVKRAQETVC
jgi:ABC-type nitrate/sulfonate/bicarbonate transport system substrate-binding protein